MSETEVGRNFHSSWKNYDLTRKCMYRTMCMMGFEDALCLSLRLRHKASSKPIIILLLREVGRNFLSSSLVHVSHDVYDGFRRCLTSEK